MAEGGCTATIEGRAMIEIATTYVMAQSFEDWKSNLTDWYQTAWKLGRWKDIPTTEDYSESRTFHIREAGRFETTQVRVTITPILNKLTVRVELHDWVVGIVPYMNADEETLDFEFPLENRR